MQETFWWEMEVKNADFVTFIRKAAGSCVSRQISDMSDSTGVTFQELPVPITG